MFLDESCSRDTCSGISRLNRSVLSFAGVAFQPEFSEPITNLTVPVGRDATFQCMVTHLGGYRVSCTTLSPAEHNPSHVTFHSVEVTLRLTVSQSVSQSVLVSITLVGLATRYFFLSECCCLVSVGRPLWREDGSPICSVVTEWSESRRTRNHTLLSHLRLPQPGGPGSRIYIPQEQGDPVMPPVTEFCSFSWSRNSPPDGPNPWILTF
jgi:hypothetical protein